MNTADLWSFTITRLRRFLRKGSADPRSQAPSSKSVVIPMVVPSLTHIPDRRKPPQGRCCDRC
jgi:hypothetical protein